MRKTFCDLCNTEIPNPYKGSWVVTTPGLRMTLRLVGPDQDICRECIEAQLKKSTVKAATADENETQTA